jgi:hypothetical protein
VETYRFSHIAIDERFFLDWTHDDDNSSLCVLTFFLLMTVAEFGSMFSDTYTQ